MASVIAVLDIDANLLLSRTYSHDFIPIDDIITSFRTLLASSNSLPPVINHKGINYIYLQNNEVILVIVTYYEHVNVMSLLTFLYKFNEILMSYFKVDMLNKDLIIDNFNLIYELFDEIMDYGIPQLTDISILKDVIKLEVNKSILDDGGETKPDDETKKSKKKNKKDQETRNVNDELEHEINSSILRTTTSSVSWRPKGIFYKKNEFFVDVIERISLVVDRDLKIVKYLINGTINIKSYLSGMPVLKIGLSKLTQSDSTASYEDQFFAKLHLHQCVELERFSKDKIIEFIPPDGRFELCSYSLLVKALPVIQLLSHDFILRQDGKTLRIKITAKTNFKINSTMKALIIKIPIDLEKYDIDFHEVPKFKTRVGKVFYKFDENCIIWKIDAIGGDREFTMMSEFKLHTDDEQMVKKELGMDPPPKSNKPEFNKIHDLVEEEIGIKDQKDITIEFELPDLTLSSLKINYLKITEDQLNYTSFPWVRYKILSSNEYIYRL